MFEYPQAFLLFLSIPFVVFFFIYDIILLKKRIKIISGNNTASVVPYYSEGQKWIKLVFFSLGLCFAILALARPKWGIKTIEADVKGRDILILLDVSNSMMTKDVFPNRFEFVKFNIMELLNNETGDRFGLMAFSDYAELIAPITFDYASINFFLDSLSPGMLGKGGTNIGNALLESINSFEDDGTRHKMILLLTDGENMQGDLNNSLKKIKESGIRVFTAGIGTTTGEPIPIMNSKGDIESYLKDNNDKIVISKLDTKNLKLIASETSGKFLGLIDSRDILRYSVQNIKEIEKKSQKSIKFEQKNERYDIFLIPALIFFSLGFILDQGRLIRRNDKSKWNDLLNRIINNNK